MCARSWHNSATYQASRLLERDRATWVEFTGELLKLAPKDNSRQWAISRLSVALQIRLQELGARDPGDKGLEQLATDLVDSVRCGAG